MRAQVFLLAFALGGCASQGVQFHSLPPETPAADNAEGIVKAQGLAAVAALSAQQTAAASVGAQQGANEAKGAEAKGAEAKGAEGKGTEGKGAEGKGAEGKGAEGKGAE